MADPHATALRIRMLGVVSALLIPYVIVRLPREAWSYTKRVGRSILLGRSDFPARFGR